MLVCIAKTALSYEAFRTSTCFSVNVLSDAQRDISQIFASQSANKFKLGAWTDKAAEMPVLAHALANFICQQENLVEAGDHVIMIGRVLDMQSQHGAPLGYFKGNYFSVGLDQPLISAVAKSGTVKLGGVLSRDGEVLLKIAHDGSCSVPLAPTDDTRLIALVIGLAVVGLEAELSVLYSVYQENETGLHGIFYHGSVTGEAPRGYGYFAITELPLDRVTDKAERSMLARYAQEARQGNFGIYQGDQSAGTVHRTTGREPSKL